MRRLLLAGLLSVTTCLAQVPVQEPQQAPTDQVQAGSPPNNGMITIPAGTKVPVTLASPIRLKAAQQGYGVRVATAFPLTVGTQLAIPAGTYLEGVVDKVQKRVHAGEARLQMHFTRMVYSNGYEVDLTDATASASAHNPDEKSLGAAGGGNGFAMGNSLLPQQVPPPLPQVGPSKGEVIGIGLAVTAAVTVVAILLAHHHGNGSEDVIDAGTQFDLIFQAPISVDGSRVSSSVAQ